MPPPALVIFDCDGVLVDSERIAVEIDQKVLAMAGIHLSQKEIVERFVGRSASVMDAVIEEHLGGPLPTSLKLESERLYREAFASKLTPVDGIEEALDMIPQPICVASSSTPDSLRQKLELCGLRDRFGERIYSASQVARGKPAPDLFLFAAAQMEVSPAHCAVVEDSLYGIQAGLAANMRVFAYAGGIVEVDRLKREDVTVFDDMRELPSLLGC